MEKEYATDILACLPHTRSQFEYFSDYYVVQLLNYAIEERASIAQLRRSKLSRLLNNPILKHVLSNAGDGVISSERLWPALAHSPEKFLLTVGLWGGEKERCWHQTSRNGYNLVLRLNFNSGHDQQFRRLMAPITNCAFNGYSHPVLGPKERSYFRETLAWARLDVDLESGQALVEEIQSDWVRRVKDTERRLKRWEASSRPKTEPKRFWIPSCETTPEQAREYIDKVFTPFRNIWDQAMLSAVLHFVIDELGLDDLWYHTWQTGSALKGIEMDWAPPRSLYSRLPRQFCFGETSDMPVMLQHGYIRRRLKRAHAAPRFYRLNLANIRRSTDC